MYMTAGGSSHSAEIPLRPFLQYSKGVLIAKAHLLGLLCGPLYLLNFLCTAQEALHPVLHSLLKEMPTP